jgi:hypothetical protein
MIWNAEEIAEFFANNEHKEIVDEFCSDFLKANLVYTDLVVREFDEETIVKFRETYL